MGFYSNAYKKLGLNPDADNVRQMQPNQKRKQPMSHYMIPTANTMVQADLTHWNTDNGYKYLLVAIDVVSQKTDFEAIKSKDYTAIINGFNEIFKRQYIKPTFKYLYCDAGTEFNNKFLRDYFAKFGIYVRITRVGRKNQNCYVEGMNNIINRILATKTNCDMLEDKTKNREWVQYLPELRKIINARKIKRKVMADFLTPIELNAKEDLLKVGTEVYLPLEKPENVFQVKERGRFRNGDLRFTKDKYKIDTVIYGNPMRYMVDGVNNASFRKNELLIANPTKWTNAQVSEFVKKNIKKTISYKVKQIGKREFVEFKGKIRSGESIMVNGDLYHIPHAGFEYYDLELV